LSSQNPLFNLTLFLTLYTPHFILNQINPKLFIHLLFPQSHQIHSLIAPINNLTLIKINPLLNSIVNIQILICLFRHHLITPSFSADVNIPLYLSLISLLLTFTLNPTISIYSRKHPFLLSYHSISIYIKITINPSSLHRFHSPLYSIPHNVL
jgi:hypothetical protein